MAAGDAGALVVSGPVARRAEGHRDLSLAGNSICVTIGNNNQDTAYSRRLEQHGLEKGRTGRLTMTGANTYTGLTTAAAGTLELGPSARTRVQPRRAPTFRTIGRSWCSTTRAEPRARTIRPRPSCAAQGQLPQQRQPGSLANGGKIFGTTAAASAGARALGWSDNGASQVTVMQTLPGDCNLDGTVGFDDLNVVAGELRPAGR